MCFPNKIQLFCLANTPALSAHKPLKPTAFFYTICFLAGMPWRAPLLLNFLEPLKSKKTELMPSLFWLNHN